MTRALTLFLAMMILSGCSGGSDKASPPSQESTPAVANQTEPEALGTEAFSYSVAFSDPLPDIDRGSAIEVPVRIKNTSTIAWPGSAIVSSSKPLNASYHILSAKGDTLVWDGVRTPIDADVPPGGEIALKLGVTAPERAGNYELHFDLVQESVSWFGGKDATRIARFRVK